VAFGQITPVGHVNWAVDMARLSKERWRFISDEVLSSSTLMTPATSCYTGTKKRQPKIGVLTGEADRAATTDGVDGRNSSQIGEGAPNPAS
jgi:hypothetical protein